MSGGEGAKHLAFWPPFTDTHRQYGQELLLRNEYLVTANRILRNQLKGRSRLSDGERKALEEIG